MTTLLGWLELKISFRLSAFLFPPIDGTDILDFTMSPSRDRSTYPVRKIILSEEGSTSDVMHLSPSERVALVWQLTAQAWTFKDGTWDEPRLRRDVVRTQRNED